jgi:hypothetical protein
MATGRCVPHFATGRSVRGDAPVMTRPDAIRTRAGAFVWTVDAQVEAGTVRRDDESGRVELKTALPADVPVLAARFDNLKDGAPAIVKAPDAGPPKASETATRDGQAAGSRS